MKSLFTVLFVAFTLSAVAQGQSKSSASNAAKSTSPGNCYAEWYSIFKERGAKPIPNGSHDVIITIRYGNHSDCYMGKIDVLDGRINSRLLVQKVDGSYGEWDRKLSADYFDDQGNIKDRSILLVSNGMSSEFTGSEGNLVRLFFYQSVGEKPKANKKAPSPSTLIIN